MTPPAANPPSHLYVMQSAQGRIKIGRSKNPDRRRRQIERMNGYKVHLIAVLHGRGDDELAVHTALAQFRRIGEWFDDTQAARDAICATIGRPIKFVTGIRDRAQHARDARAKYREDEQAAETKRAVRAYVEEMLGGPVSPAWIAAQDAEEALYRKKTTLEEVNALRAAAGMGPLA